MPWNLPKALTEHSVGTWPANLKEWHLDHVYDSEETDYCLCSHWIHEVCVVKNEHNGDEVKIGNCCIRLFEKHAPSFKGMHTVADCLKRIKGDAQRAPNAGLIQQAFQSKILNQWEVKFCTDTARKRNLSDAQATKRAEINQKLLLGICTSAKRSLELIAQDTTYAANPKLVDAALIKRVIQPKQADFLKETWVKPYTVLTPKQKEYRKNLNVKIVKQLKL